MDSKLKVLKKYLILTGIFIAFHIVMFFTNPYKDLHVQKITSTIHFIEKENSAMTLDLMNELFLDSYISHEVSYHKYGLFLEQLMIKIMKQQ